MGDDVAADREPPVDHGFGEDLVRGSGTHHRAVDEHEDTVAVLRGQVQIVQCRYHRDAQPFCRTEHAVLMLHVEMVGRFVEHEHLWLLGQSTGDQDALLLAAGQRGEQSRAQIPGIGLVHRLPDGLVFGGTVAGDDPAVWQSPGGDHLARCEVEMQGVVLGQRGHLTGILAHADGTNVALTHHDMTVGRLQRPIQTAQRRGFAAAVGPDDPDELTRLDGQVHVAHHQTAADLDVHVIELHAHQICTIDASRRFIKNTNTGTPTAAVIAPSGSSCGGTTVRDNRSAETRKTAPSKGVTMMSRR